MNKIKNSNIDIQLKAAVLLAIKKMRERSVTTFSVVSVVEEVAQYKEAWQNCNGGTNYDAKIGFIFKDLRDAAILIKTDEYSYYQLDESKFNVALAKVAKDIVELYDVEVYYGETEEDTEVYCSDAEKTGSETFLSGTDLLRLVESAVESE